jgi:predicted peroxiredoxin
MTTDTNNYVFSITHFDNDPERVAVPLVLANNALAMGSKVLVWLTLDAVKLASNTGPNGLQSKSFPSIDELLKTFADNGGEIGVCPPCAKTHDLTEDDLTENANFMGAAAFLEQTQVSQTAWF